MAETITVGETDVLVVVDVQNDFVTGSLATPGSEAIVPVINRLGRLFTHVIVTQDWHPPGHVSFASAHPGTHPGDFVEVDYGAQKVFKDHCVIDTPGADLHPDIDLPNTELVVRKGFRRDIDSYSAFVENDRKTTTGLAALLKARGLKRVFLCGLALYGCVKFSALGARDAGFPAWVIDDASCSRPDPVNDPVSSAELADAGVQRLKSHQLTA